jgi:hypothetical protein
MRPFLFISLALTFTGCTRQKATDTLVTDNLKYSAYYWHLNQNTDSFQFYLAHYLDIDKNGNFKIMRHDEFMDKPKYFEGTLTDTIQKLIDTTFLYENYKTDYAWNVNDGTTYDGFTYCFDITKNDTNKKVLFIPRNSPVQIKSLSALLDTIIYNRATKRSDDMNLKPYENVLSRYHIAMFGQLPKIQKVPPKFEPDKIPK